MNASSQPTSGQLPEHVILQRLAVRMLHDDQFRASVYQAPQAALAGLSLSPSAQHLLVSADPRAWTIDTHRSTRVLKALLDEYPVSALAVLHEGVAPGSLHAFFQSPFFHDAIMVRGSLAPALGRYLASRARSAVSVVIIELEAAIVRVRRRVVVAASEPTGFVARGAFEGLMLPEGTLAAWDKARAALARQGDPVASLLGKGPHPRLELRVGAERAREAVLLERGVGGEPTAAFAGEALVQLLALTEGPTALETLVDRAREEGASAEEAAEIIAELVAEGLLVAVARHLPAVGA